VASVVIHLQPVLSRGVLMLVLGRTIMILGRTLNAAYLKLESWLKSWLAWALLLLWYKGAHIAVLCHLLAIKVYTIAHQCGRAID